MKIALFTLLKPFEGKISDMQIRSLENWSGVFRGCDLIRFEGPIVPFCEMLRRVETESDADVLMYANGDLLFPTEAFEKISAIRREGNFMLTGQRVDILEDGVRRLHRPSGMDYFVFRRGMFHDLPRVLMGRAYCDNALVAYCLRNGIPVIDASYALLVEHQFHDYGHVTGGRKTVWQGEEAVANKRMNELGDFGPNVLDATHTLLPNGAVVPNIRKRPHCWGLWHFITRGGKWWKNPKWDGVAPI